MASAMKRCYCWGIAVIILIGIVGLVFSGCTPEEKQGDTGLSTGVSSGAASINEHPSAGVTDGNLEPSGEEKLPSPASLPGSSPAPEQPTQNVNLDMEPRVLFIIAQNNFRDEELTIPRRVLGNAGIPSDVASLTTDTATGMFGLEVMPDVRVIDVQLDKYTMVVVVGGSGALDLAEREEVTGFVHEADQQGKLLGAICLGPTVLAQAGVLEGKRATVWSSAVSRESIKTLEDNGALYVHEPVVVDGRIVTAWGPDKAQGFGEKLVEMIALQTSK